MECKAHTDYAIQAAEKGIVLLKNNGILPLCKENLTSIGVIGPNANSRAALIGNYYGTSSRYITVLEGIQELSQIRKEHIKMIIDGEEVEDDFLFGAICNSTSVGGILTLDPEVVDLQDNKLEILLVRAPKNLAEIHECIVALNTQKYNCAMLTFRSATHIRIFADPDMPWTLDGEREEGHSEVVVTPQHLAYRLMKRQ